MKKQVMAFLGALAASTATLWAAETNPRLFKFRSDVETGISSAKTYTHAYNMGGGSGTFEINGVTFTNTGLAANTGITHGWSGFPPLSASGNAGAISTPDGYGYKIRDLLGSLNYNLANGTMTITGLEPGVLYEFCFYNRAWGSANRTQTLTFKPGEEISDTITFNPDDTAEGDRVLAYRYVAPASGELQIHVQAHVGANTFHVYGFSNEQAYGVTPRDESVVGDTYATLNAKVFPAGHTATITLQFKEDDADYSEAAWQAAGVTKMAAGAYETESDIAVPLATLNAGTSYAYRFTLSNDVEVVASPARVFTTYTSAPVIRSLKPAAIVDDSATTTAFIDFIASGIDTGATVELFWGETDGGTDAAAWQSVVSLGEQALGAVSHVLDGFDNGVMYFYRHRISYGDESAWASESVKFMVRLTSLANPRIVLFSGDAASGISSAKTYTHALDFGGVIDHPIVNNVPFLSTAANAGTIPGTTFTWSGFPAKAYGNGTAGGIITSGSDQGIYHVLNDFFYDTANGTARIGGLTEGRLYEIRFYQRKWGGPRTCTFTFSTDAETLGDIPFDPDAYAQDTFLSFIYVADASGALNINYKGLVSGATYHCYGLSNELVGSLLAVSETSVADTFATLNGTIFTGGMRTRVVTQVKVDDGAFDEASWQSSGVATYAVEGVLTEDGAFSVTLPTGSLAIGATYAYRFVLDNSFNLVASASRTFTTRSTSPAIYSRAAENITSAAATAMAWVDYIAPGVTTGATVDMFWGETDGGDNAAAWEHSVSLGAQVLGNVSHALTGLKNATTYYYRHRINNGMETAWAPASVNFITTGLPSFADLLTVPYSESCYFSASLADAGAGTSTVTLLLGGSADSLAPVRTWPAVNTVTHFAHIINKLANGTTHYFAFRAETEMPDAPGVIRMVETPAKAVTIAAHGLPNGTVTWTGNGGDQRWGNPLNWDTGAIPGPYNRVRITTANLSEEARVIFVDGPFVIGDLVFDANTALAPNADDASLTLLNSYIGGGNGHIITVPLFLGRSSNWQSNDSWGGSITVSGPVSDYDIGATIYTTGNQNNNANLRGPWNTTGNLYIQNMSTALDNDFSITNSAGVYIAGWAYHNGSETTLNLYNSTPRSNRFAPGVTLGVHHGSGSFTYHGNSDVPVREDISLLDLQGGRLNMTVNGVNAGPLTTLHFDEIRRDAGACVTLTFNHNARFSVRDAHNQYGPIWQPWMMFYNHYTTVDSEGFITTVNDNDYTELAATGNAPDALGQLTQPELTLTTSATVAGLRLNTANLQTLDLGAHDFTIASGAMIACGDSEKRIESTGGGALVFGGDDIVIHCDNGGHALDIAAPVAWSPSNPGAPARPSIIIPRLNNSGDLRFTGEDRIGDYEALTCFPVWNGGAPAVIFDGSSNRTFHGPFAGAFNLYKYGSGTLRLNGPARTRGGSVILYEGTVMIGAANTFGVYLCGSGGNLSVAEGVTYSGFPTVTEPGMTLGGFGTFSYWSMNGTNLKSGSRVAPGDAATIGTLTFGGAFGHNENTALLEDLFFDIKINGANNDRVHIANSLRKPYAGNTWTFVIKDLSRGRKAVGGKTYVLMDWTGNLENIESTVNLVPVIHPDSRRYIYADDAKITLDAENKQIRLTGLHTMAAGLFMIR